MTRSTNRSLLILLIGLGAGSSAWSQGFSSGSDGTYGALVVTNDTTLDIPPSGILNCTTINVASGRTLRFRKNANNTPIHLLATGDVTIVGTINVAGAPGNNIVGGDSGPGGFSGGNPASVSVPPGAGYGPGAGRGGNANATADGAGGGAYATVPNVASTNKGAAYGSALLIPIVGGSGGGGTQGTPGTGGGGGGGGILIASNTRVDLTGTINAEGGGNTFGVNNGGSGGAIRLVAPVVAGSGTVRVGGGGGAGGGRIRIDAINRPGIAFSFFPNGVTSVGSMMLVFPLPTPKLDLVEAAGSPIPVGSGPVLVQLPFGSTPDRTIKIQAQDFNDLVPVRVVLTPDNGTPVSYDTQLDNRASNPAQTTVNVTFPVNVQTAVNVWTR